MTSLVTTWDDAALAVRSRRGGHQRPRGFGGLFVVQSHRSPAPTSYYKAAEWVPSHSRRKSAVLAAQTTLDGISTDQLGATGISPLTRQQVLRFIERVAGRESTYASIVPDEDGVAVLHWVAGSRSLQVDVSETGPTYLWTRDEGGRTRVATKPVAIYNIAEDVLGRITKDVNRVNPRWRELFR